VFYDLLHELLKADRIWNSTSSMMHNLDDPYLEEGHEELQVNPYEDMYVCIMHALLLPLFTTTSTITVCVVVRPLAIAGRVCSSADTLLAYIHKAGLPLTAFQCF
jgi:hypothetical protein